MKLTKHENQVKTNFKAESQNFGIGDPGVIIEILRNKLYKNKIQVLVQEYLCNGRDAMREIDSDKAIKVTIPSQFDPIFKVRDFGPGLSPERIREVFTLYGASTKRDSNKQTGGFGIGSKSAWSYTDSFTVIGYLDGIKRTYIAHTGDSPHGTMDLISEEKTDAQNGTEIQIGVNPSDIRAFEKAILRATHYWNEKVKYIGEFSHVRPFEREKGNFFTDYLEVVNGMPNCVDRFSTDTHAIIDGIPYNIGYLSNEIQELADLENLMDGTLLIHVPTGFLEVAASREEVDNSQHTVKNLKALCKKLSKEIHKHILSEFSKVKSVEEYLKTYIELIGTFSLSKYESYDSYKMDYNCITSKLFSLANVYECETNPRTLGLQKNNINSKKGKNSLNTFRLPIDLFDCIYYIDSDESKVKQNKRIRSFLESNRKMILLDLKKDDKTHKEAYEKLKFDLGAKKLSEIEIKELPKVVTSSPKSKNSYEICLHVLKYNRWHRYNEKPYIREHRDVDLKNNTENFLYVPLEGNAWKEFSKYEAFKLGQYFGGYTICGISKTNLKKVKGNKNFKSLKEFLDNYKPNVDDILNVKYYHTGVESRESMEVIKELKGLKDDFLNDMKEEFKGVSFCEVPKLIKDKCNQTPEIISFIEKVKKLNNLVDTVYPLVRQFKNEYLSDETKQELAFYINAKNKENK